MEYITTTDLRSKTTQLINILKKNGSVSLIHRSKIIGMIQPIEPAVKPFDGEAFKRIIKDLNLSQTVYTQREKIYQNSLMKKYGKNIS